MDEFEACAECGFEKEDFHHTCKLTDCRTPHDIHDFVPSGEFIVIREIEVSFPPEIFGAEIRRLN